MHQWYKLVKRKMHRWYKYVILASMPIEKRDVCICNACGHTWLSADPDKLPLRCAKCKSILRKHLIEHHPLENDSVSPIPRLVHPQSQKKEVEKGLSNQASARRSGKRAHLRVEKALERNTGKPKRCAHGFFVVSGRSACPHRCKR
jgi:hypothetical protein